MIAIEDVHQGIALGYDNVVGEIHPRGRGRQRQGRIVAIHDDGAAIAAGVAGAEIARGIKLQGALVEGDRPREPGIFIAQLKSPQTILGDARRRIGAAQGERLVVCDVDERFGGGSGAAKVQGGGHRGIVRVHDQAPAPDVDVSSQIVADGVGARCGGECGPHGDECAAHHGHDGGEGANRNWHADIDSIIAWNRERRRAAGEAGVCNVQIALKRLSQRRECARDRRSAAHGDHRPQGLNDRHTRSGGGGIGACDNRPASKEAGDRRGEGSNRDGHPYVVVHGACGQVSDPGRPRRERSCGSAVSVGTGDGRNRGARKHPSAG